MSIRVVLADPFVLVRDITLDKSMHQHMLLIFRTGLLLLVSCTAGWAAIPDHVAQAQERGQGMLGISNQRITLHTRSPLDAARDAEVPVTEFLPRRRPSCANVPARPGGPAAPWSFWTCTDNPVFEYVALGAGLAATGVGTYFLVHFFNALSAEEAGLEGIAVIPLFLPGALLTSLGLPVTIRGIRCLVKMENPSALLPSDPSHASSSTLTLTIRF